MTDVSCAVPEEDADNNDMHDCTIIVSSKADKALQCEISNSQDDKISKPTKNASKFMY